MIEVKTVLDKTTLLKLNKFHSFRKNNILIFIPMICIIAIGVLMYVFPEKESDKYFGILFSVFFCLCFPIIVYGIMRLKVWLQLRSAKFISDETKIYYKFDENVIYNQVEKEGMKSTNEWAWSLCHKAYETKDYFYIYISNMQAHVVPKKDFITGSAQELSNILSSRINIFKQYK